MNDQQRKMTIGELADAAGVTVRTIRYYVNEGLLPSPEQNGRYTLYEPWYLDRLVLIRRWKDAYLPLKEIRARIHPLSNQDVRQILTNQASVAPPAAVSLGLVPQETWEGESPDEDKPEAPPEKAIDYIHQVQKKGEPVEPSKREVSEYIRRARRESRRDVRPIPHPAPAPHPQTGGTQWRRIEVFPGFELNITEEITRRYWRELEELMDWIARNITSKN